MNLTSYYYIVSDYLDKGSNEHGFSGEHWG